MSTLAKQPVLPISPLAWPSLQPGWSGESPPSPDLSQTSSGPSSQGQLFVGVTCNLEPDFGQPGLILVPVWPAPMHSGFPLQPGGPGPHPPWLAHWAGQKPPL